MYRCIPFVVNNTPEKDWLFSILRQTQSIQAQDEWYLEYLPNTTDSDSIILYTIWAKKWRILLLIFMITDECIWWGPGEFVLADCQCVISYLIPRPSPIPWPYAPNIESVDKHWVGDTRGNQSYWEFTQHKRHFKAIHFNFENIKFILSRPFLSRQFCLFILAPTQYCLYLTNWLLILFLLSI